MLQTLVSNPDVWSKTVLFHMYDENDGFFDHVDPPVPPPGTAGEFLTVDPLPADANGIAGPIGLGFRVPLLVVSPFSRGGQHLLADLRPHLAAAVHRGALRGEGAEPLGVAPIGGRRPDRHPPHGPEATPRCRALPPPATTPPTWRPRGARETDLLEIATNQPPYPVPTDAADADPGALERTYHVSERPRPPAATRPDTRSEDPPHGRAKGQGRLTIT